MFLKELEIVNFGLIKYAHLMFSDSNPVVGIIGRYEAEEDSGRSNRVGKSTLVMANEYLLFGHARTRHHSKLINRTAKQAGEGMSVKGVYVLGDGKEIEIVRSRTNEGKGVATLTDHEGSGWKEANEAIEELIGFTHSENKNTANFSQGDIHAFMKSNPKEKRQLLLEWLDQSRWEDRAEYARQEVEKAKAKCSQLEHTLNALPEPEGDPVELEEQAETADGNADITRQEIEAAEEKLETLKAEYNKVVEAARFETEKTQILNSIEIMEGRLEKAEEGAKKKRQLEEEIKAHREELRGVGLDHDSELSEIQVRKTRTRDERNQARDRWEATLKTGGVCPVLNESCNRVDPEQTGDLREVARQTQDAYEVVQAEYRGVRVRQEGEVEELESTLEALERDLRRLVEHYVTDPSGYEEMLDRLDGQLEAVSDKIPEGGRPAQEIQADKMNCGDEIKELNRALGQYETQARTLRQAAKRARDYVDKKERIKANLEAAKLDHGAWSYCAYMFGDRGIPNEYITDAFENLESDVNYILGRINCGLSVEFKPYRELKSFEKSCIACGTEFKSRQKGCLNCGELKRRKRKEELVLIIHDEAEGMPSEFALDSGGGQTLISFAVRLALLFFKIRSGKSEVPPVVLDEIASMLDPVNRQAIMDIVLNILTEEYGVQQIFWISHNPDIKDMIENSLVVTRSGNHSMVDWL